MLFRSCEGKGESKVSGYVIGAGMSFVEHDDHRLVPGANLGSAKSFGFALPVCPFDRQDLQDQESSLPWDSTLP